MNKLAKSIVAGIITLAIFAPPSQAAFTPDFQTQETIGGVTTTFTTEVVNDPRIAEYVAISSKYWGELPKCDDLTFRFMTSDLPNPFIGKAYINDGSSSIYRCGRWIDKNWYYSSFNDQSFSYSLCGLVNHELGHGVGQSHGQGRTLRDPLGTMDYGIMGVPPECSALLPQKTSSGIEPAQPSTDGSARGYRDYSWPQDRKWCRRHQAKCQNNYPKLYKRVISKKRK